MRFVYISEQVSTRAFVKALSLRSYKAVKLFHCDTVSDRSGRDDLTRLFEEQSVIERRLEVEFGLNPGAAEGLLTMLPSERAARRFLTNTGLRSIVNDPTTKVTLVMPYLSRMGYCRMEYKGSLRVVLRVGPPPYQTRMARG